MWGEDSKSIAVVFPVQDEVTWAFLFTHVNVFLYIRVLIEHNFLKYLF